MGDIRGHGPEVGVKGMILPEVGDGKKWAGVVEFVVGAVTADLCGIAMVSGRGVGATGSGTVGVAVLAADADKGGIESVGE